MASTVIHKVVRQVMAAGKAHEIFRRFLVEENGRILPETRNSDQVGCFGRIDYAVTLFFDKRRFRRP